MGNGFDGGMDAPCPDVLPLTVDDYKYTFDFYYLDFYFFSLEIKYNIKKYETNQT